MNDETKITVMLDYNECFGGYTAPRKYNDAGRKLTDEELMAKYGRPPKPRVVGLYSEDGKKLKPEETNLSDHFCPLLDTPRSYKRNKLAQIYYWIKVRFGFGL